MRIRPIVDTGCVSTGLLALACTLAVVLVTGCNGDTPGRLSVLSTDKEAWSCNTPFSTMVQGLAPSIESETFQVIESAEEWCSFWDQIYPASGGHPLPCDPAAVNFAKEVGLLAALGGRGTGGYGVTIGCVDTDPDSGKVRVQVVETRPGASCLVPQMFTFPATLAKMDRPAGSVSFERVVTVHECAP